MAKKSPKYIIYVIMNTYAFVLQSLYYPCDKKNGIMYIIQKNKTIYWRSNGKCCHLIGRNAIHLLYVISSWLPRVTWWAMFPPTYCEDDVLLTRRWWRRFLQTHASLSGTMFSIVNISYWKMKRFGKWENSRCWETEFASDIDCVILENSYSSWETEVASGIDCAILEK